MLSSIRILDLTRVLAGPLCTMMLGDLGADVLKVERAGVGDDTRGWGPPFDGNDQSAYFLSVNRNKLGIAVDFDDAADLRLLIDMARDADVVVENFRPGTLERRGWGVERARAVHPGLVWCTISGFGLDSVRPGYDLVVQAECGWMSITGEPDGYPMKHGVALADVIAGKDAAIAILGALVSRGRTGEGRQVHVSLEASAQAALINVAQNTLVGGAAPKRWGNAHANLVPYQLFEAQDRTFVLAVGSDAQWRGCVRALELHDLATDAALATNAGRLAQRNRVISRMSERLAEAPADSWLRKLEEAGVPCGLVRTVPEVLSTVDASAVSGLPPSIPGAVRRAPPTLGEHDSAVRAHGWNAFARVPVRRS